MKNGIQSGATISFTAGANLSSGDVVVLGNQLGVVQATVASGAVGTACMEGVFSLPKTSGASTAMTVGSSPIWDVSAGAFIKQGSSTATGDVSNAVTVWSAAADGDTTVTVKINTSKGTVA